MLQFLSANLTVLPYSCGHLNAIIYSPHHAGGDALPPRSQKKLHQLPIFLFFVSVPRVFRFSAQCLAVDPLPLEAWVGVDLSDIVAGACVAVIGCGRLGRDFVRCLLLTGACTGPRGRMVFIDHGETAPSYPSASPIGQQHQPGKLYENALSS